MKSIAFFNNKGGVGKTTLLCNVAAYLAINMKKKVLVVDADPQCNATQLMLSDEMIEKFYEKTSSFTIYSIIKPLSVGKGYSKEITSQKIKSYGVNLVPGDPKLSLVEDLLATDWQSAISGNVRGMRTSFVFSDFLRKCGDYDYVLFDVGPSLGAINRAVLLSCDYFISPMSIDIFSIRAIENISVSLNSWKKRLAHGLDLLDEDESNDLPKNVDFDIKFAGYVAQQYAQKTIDGNKRAVNAYERIMKKIPSTINESFVTGLGQDSINVEYELGKIPNLYSLIPMSQTARKPVFALRSKDGVRGAHFNRVRDAEDIFGSVAKKLQYNVSSLDGDWPDSLVDSLARRKAVVVIGSGVSANSSDINGGRPPTWGAFLQTALKTLPVRKNIIAGAIKRFQYLEACAYLKNAMGEQAWNDLIRVTFIAPNYRPADIHKAILNIDPRIVVSMNFDNIYDRYVTSKDDATFIVKNYYDEDIRQVVAGNDRYVLKLHGTADTATKMIFTLEDYAKARSEHARFYEMFSSILHTHTFLFIGCGLADPDMQLIFENHKYKFGETPHYMTLAAPVTTEQKELIRKTRGINILTYSSADNHAELTTSLQELIGPIEGKRTLISEAQNW